MSTFIDEAYAQDVIAPARVEHRVEFGDRSSSGFGFTYNFLVYEFREGAAYAEAMHYLDEPARVHLRLLRPYDLNADFTKCVLVFLRMRYEDIEIWSDCGQQSAPADESLTEAVEVKLNSHMQQVAY